MLLCTVLMRLSARICSSAIWRAKVAACSSKPLLWCSALASRMTSQLCVCPGALLVQLVHKLLQLLATNALVARNLGYNLATALVFLYLAFVCLLLHLSEFRHGKAVIELQSNSVRQLDLVILFHVAKDLFICGALTPHRLVDRHVLFISLPCFC